MNGVDIIGEILLADAPVTGTVAVARIKAGALPENAPLPSLLVRSVTTIERLMLKRGLRVRCVERVSVTVRAASYAQQVAIMKLLPTACAGKTGDFADATNVSVLSAGIGPDVIGPGGSFEQTIDFRVSYEIAA
jgi:hypothetical protein